ncbi:MAG: hypothetical protein ABSF52_06595 [Syntrophobacteraceae bacterium]|jgi:hypothetical protein
MERFQKCKNLDKPVCHPDVKFIATLAPGSQPLYLTDHHFQKAKEACENCENYNEKK